MEITFLGKTGGDNSYSSFDPETQTKIKFLSGERKDILDSIANRLIETMPELFGVSINSIRKARGEKILRIPSSKPKEKVSEKITHPAIKALKKVAKKVAKGKSE